MDSKRYINNKPYSDKELETETILYRKDILHYLKSIGNRSEEELSI